MARRQLFEAGGIPKHVRVYDNGGETTDRYTIVFTYAHRIGFKGRVPFMGSGVDPRGMSYFADMARDIFALEKGNKRIRFTDLPDAVQREVLHLYRELWNVKPDVTLMDGEADA